MGLHSEKERHLEALEPLDEASCSQAWSRSCSRPAMIVTPGLHLLWCNQEGRRLLDSDRDLAEVGRRLSFSRKTAGFGFAVFLEGLGEEPQAWVLARRDGCDCLIVRAVQISLGQDRAVILAISDTSQARRLWADFGSALDLTCAEANLLKRLVDGATVKEAAIDLGITLETARTHVKRAYAKLGVSSREEMFARISPFRLS